MKFIAVIEINDEGIVSRGEVTVEDIKGELIQLLNEFPLILTLKQFIPKNEYEIRAGSKLNPCKIKKIKKVRTGPKRGVNLNAIRAVIASPKTPKQLKEGLLRKYGHLI